MRTTTDTIATARPVDTVPLLTVTFPTAKKITGLGLTSLWKLGKEKRIEIVHVGRRALITVRSLEKLLLPATDAPQLCRRRSRPGKRSNAAVTQ
jgi:hypothetical protein